MFRGILSTIYVDLNKGKSINSLYKELANFYKKSAFVKVKKLNSLISTNDVINTNNCKISICKSKYKNKAIILSSIDNLIKGGAGQAIQNMNIFYNFNVKEGLL
jgi:N-acetyl-gamma-glutamyl-phosphate reductase